MTKKYDIDWNNIDWDETGPAIKSDGAVNKGDANRRTGKNPRWDTVRKKAAQERDNKAILSKRKKSGWHEKNAERYNDPKFRAKQAAAVAASNPALDPNKRDQWLAANRKAQEQTRKPIHTPYGVFESKGAADAVINGFNVSDRLKTHPHLYYYLEDGPGETTYEKVYYMDFGYSNKLRPLHKTWCMINNQQPSANVNSWFKRMCKQDPDNYYVKTEPKREWALEETNNE